MESSVPQDWSNALIAVLLITLAAMLRSLHVGKPWKLPPSPGGLPWIGQAFEIPKFHSYLYYTELHKKLGDIYSLTALGQKFIVLNTYEVAFEVLGRHGVVHCDRPPNPYRSHFLGLANLITIRNADQDWKEARRLIQLVFSKESCRTNYAKDVAAQARGYVLRGIECVQDQNNGLLDVALHKSILQSTYGIILDEEDPIVKNALLATEVASVSLLPTRYLVNLFPPLRYLPAWVPFQPWRAEAKEARKVLDPLTETPWQRFLVDNAAGKANDSVALSITSEQSSTNAHLLPTLASTNLIAGAETTLSVCRVFVLAMLLHPEVQSKAQQEVDRVIGHDRLPNIDDQPDLPYLDAVVKEVLRWRPVGPISVPTTPRKDDSYGEYLIPRGSIVIQNTWAISREENMYPNADSFNPERWLVANPPRHPHLWSFGIGRRICPGIAYAELTYTTFIMTLLATVNIIPALDKDGKEDYVDPNILTTGRLVNSPLPFSYRMSPRSEATVSLISDSTKV
ncbi:cytochrome P450 [Clavulina sp. PMI_390]|nr:cytochrome P450 [Clavulina sp. PMI_390]